MYSKINSQAPFTDVLTLEEAKQQCNVMPSFTLDDGYITSLILACCDLAQRYTKRLLTQGSVSIRVDGYNPVIALPYGEPTIITELILDDVDVTAEIDVFEVDEITEKLSIDSTFTKLKATYDCGFTTLPTGVKQAILMMISTMYENRSDYVTGMSLDTIPVTSLKLLDSVKYYET